MSFFDTRQAEVETGMEVGEFTMVEAHEMQHRGVDVANVNSVLDGAEAEVIG